MDEIKVNVLKQLTAILRKDFWYYFKKSNEYSDKGIRPQEEYSESEWCTNSLVILFFVCMK